MNRVPPNEKVQQEYAKLAAVYDERWEFYIRATTQETLRRVSIPPGTRVLDIGCGTGTLLAHLATLDGVSLVGIDPVPEMLNQARQKLPANVQLKLGSIESVPFGADEFDLVISCNMFHYVRQPLTALQEIQRVLKPGGRFVLTDWCHDYLTCRILDRYLRAVNPSHFKTYKEQECVTLLQASGFTHLVSERYKIDWFWGMMTLQGLATN